MTTALKTTDLAAVASIYRAAAAAGEPPAVAVAERFGVHRSTAHRWLVEARASGRLEPAGPGRSIQRNARFLRVAEALGVDYEALVRAVVEHANGDLRVQS